MIDKIIDMLLSNSASCIVSILFAYLNYQMNQMQTDRKRKAEEEAKAREIQKEVDLWVVQVLLQMQLPECLSEGTVTANKLASLEKGFALYEKMGGNGEVKIKMENVRKLPLKEEG